MEIGGVAARLLRQYWAARLAAARIRVRDSYRTPELREALMAAYAG